MKGIPSARCFGGGQHLPVRSNLQLYYCASRPKFDERIWTDYRRFGLLLNWIRWSITLVHFVVLFYQRCLFTGGGFQPTMDVLLGCKTDKHVDYVGPSCCITSSMLSICWWLRIELRGISIMMDRERTCFAGEVSILTRGLTPLDYFEDNKKIIRYSLE